jgi:hypothetical protein
MNHAGWIIVAGIGAGAHGPERRRIAAARRPVGPVTEVRHFHGRLTPQNLRPGTFRISVAQDKLALTPGERAHRLLQWRYGMMVGRTPGAPDAPVGLLVLCMMLISLFRQLDGGVLAQRAPRPGGPPHLWQEPGGLKLGPERLARLFSVAA